MMPRAAGRAAREVHRSVPQLRDQLQPRQGSGARVHRDDERAGTSRRSAQVDGVCGAAVVAATAVGIEMSGETKSTESQDARYRDTQFGPPDVLSSPSARSGSRRRRGADRGRGRWRQPAGCASSGSASIRRRRAPRTFPVSKSPGTSPRSGADVARWSDGDAVCALVAGGGYAERVACRKSSACRSRGADADRGGGAFRRRSSRCGPTCSSAAS